MTFSEASLIARDLTRTVSGWVIKPGDTSWTRPGARSTSGWTSTRPWWSTPPARPISRRLSATQVMTLLHTQPDAPEIVVDRVERMRSAACDGAHDELFAAVNQAAAPS